MSKVRKQNLRVTNRPFKKGKKIGIRLRKKVQKKNGSPVQGETGGKGVAKSGGWGRNGRINLKTRQGEKAKKTDT